MDPTLLTGAATLLLPERAPREWDSVALLDGRIAAVGPAAACRSALPEGHRVVDVGGATLAPGFVDAHLHPMIMCVFEQQTRLDDCRSLADVFDAVRDAAAGAPGDHAVVGFQLDDELLVERRLPTAAELDALTPRPVVLVRRDGHHAVASGSALAAAGLAAPGSDPPGGRVERDPAGIPTGLVRERAVEVLLGLIPDVTIEGLESGLDAWVARLLSQGVTSISAMCQTTAEGPSGPAGELEAVGWSVLVERVPFDVQTILVTPEPADVDTWRDGTPLHRPDARRRTDAVKVFLDGTLGGRTACMHDPFSDADPDHLHGAHGLRTTDDGEAHRRIEAAHVAGHQVCVHAIGDEANRAAADLFARVLRDHPGPHRHRVEHASVLDAATVELFAELGVTTVVQPINLRSERHWLARRLGPERLGRTYPFRSLLDAGVAVAGSSDAPIERTDVLEAVAACADRGGLADEQAISAAEALAMYTTGGALARRAEDRLGALRPGLAADVVVLSDDPTAASDPASVRVLSTTIGGVERFRDTETEAPR